MATTGLVNIILSDVRCINTVKLDGEIIGGFKSV